MHTSLISTLLHSITVTICNNTDKTLLQLIEEATESEPAESEKLRKGEPQDVTGGTVNTALKSSSCKLTKEAKCELAVIAVKRAFSQCPNLSLLVSITHTNSNKLYCTEQYFNALHIIALHMISGLDHCTTVRSTLPSPVSFKHLLLFAVSIFFNTNTNNLSLSL
jgi:hypothetical protein